MGQKKSQPQNLPLFNLKNMNNYHFSVMSFNVLAECYCDSTSYPYAYTSSLEFKKRLQRIQKIISDLNPTILCLQELDNHEKLQLDHYQMEYMQRPGRQDGLMVAFKKENFSLISSHRYSFDQICVRDKLDQQFLRQNICMINVLQDKQTKKELMVGNIHTFWNPKNEDIKLFQAAYLVREMEKLSTPDQGKIICGDFNSLPQSNVVNYILNKSLIKKENMEYPQAFENLQKIYQLFEEPNLEWQSAYDPPPKFTNYTQKVLFFNFNKKSKQQFKGTLDYIFYNNVKSLEQWQLPDEKQLSRQVALPNEEFPSDHLPLLATFDFL